jgi:glycosyltransferase involved in cell wall biosynthesis
VITADAGFVPAPSPGSVRTSVTIVVPAYNEGTALEPHLRSLIDAFDTARDRYDVDYVFVDDGSTDDTFEIASRIAAEREDITVVRHDTNRGLGAALRTACEHSSGTYVLTVDSDLSYSVETLKQLLDTAAEENADLVVASAYMKGGKVKDVPWLRAFLSREANRFLSLATGGKYATLTCMVRAYRREFLLEKLSFDIDGMDVNADLMFQTLRAGGRVVEIPATLQWPAQRKQNAGRASLRSIAKLTWRTMACGIRYRPSLVLGIPGLIPGLLPFVVAVMVLLHCSLRTIAIGTAVTMTIQYGSLAILTGQAFSFVKQRYLKRPIPVKSRQ